MNLRHTMVLSSVLGLGCFVAGANSRPQADPSIAEQVSAGLRTGDRKTVDATVNDVLVARADLIDALIPLVDRRNASAMPDLTRSAAALLLGELRATQAVPVLVEALKKPPGRSFTTNIDIYDDAVPEALGLIGRPAVSELVEVLSKSDVDGYRMRCVYLLYWTVGGSRRLNDVLDGYIARATDAEVIRRLKKAKVAAIAFGKDTREPWF